MWANHESSLGKKTLGKMSKKDAEKLKKELHELQQNFESQKQKNQDLTDASEKFHTERNDLVSAVDKAEAEKQELR